jgi:shikimate kinase
VSVWLDTPFELCWQRIQASAEDRPLGRNREQAEQLYGLRQPVYQLATIRLPVTAHEPIENLVDRLEAELARATHNTQRHG